KITIGKIKSLSNFNNLLWYLYSVPYGLESDVLAICCLFDVSKLGFGSWVSDPNLTKKFFNLGQNPDGDIYFFWKLWTNIKTELKKFGLLDEFKIDLIKNQF